MSGKRKLDCTIIILFMLYIAACCLSGCMTTNKATAYLKDKGKLAEVCAKEYPVQSSTVYLPGDTVTEVIEVPGDTLLHFDTIWRNQYGIRVDTIVKRCPPSRIITKTVVDTITVTKESTARLDSALQQAGKYKAAAEKWKARADKRQRVNLWLIIVTCVLVGYTFRWSIVKIIKRLL